MPYPSPLVKPTILFVFLANNVYAICIFNISLELHLFQPKIKIHPFDLFNEKVQKIIYSKIGKK